jgi:hypothetical protein
MNKSFAVAVAAAALVALCLSAPVSAKPAPDTFVVVFDTTVGSFSMNCTRAWAPYGVDRFYELIQLGYGMAGLPPARQHRPSALTRAPLRPPCPQVLHAELRLPSGAFVRDPVWVKFV